MNNIRKVNLCGYCGPGITHIIGTHPNDVIAKKTKEGKWKCGNCIEREIGDMILRTTPNSARAVAGQGNSQNAAQAGLVNAQVGVGANVGAVCVNALASDTDQC
jgi:hypothetical protein